MTGHALLAHVVDQPGILFGVTRVLADHGGNITYVDFHAGDASADIYLEVTLADGTLDRVLADLRQVPGVQGVQEQPPFSKIYGKRIIVIGGGAQVIGKGKLCTTNVPPASATDFLIKSRLCAIIHQFSGKINRSTLRNSIG
jgi:uncharacterized protein with ACT and thioredoxin-like domain